MASTTYPDLSHAQRLTFVRNMALAYQACWQIPLPAPPLIGELIATSANNNNNKIILSIGPDRHANLGPLPSVGAYLQAHIKASLAALEQQQGIQDFVHNHMHKIPAIVETMPIVATHSDMGLHNIIVSATTTPTNIAAIIDWESVASAPYASLYRSIEMLFRKPAANGFGHEYDHADELREAFWGAIPAWKLRNQSESTRAFLEWFKFGLFMKPERRPHDLPDDKKDEYWRENIRLVEEMLHKYGEP
jgi:hypothetical protein